MPRQMPHVEDEGAAADGVTVSKFTIRGRRCLDVEAEALPRLMCVVVQDAVERMQVDRHGSGAQKLSDRADMVEMCVREPDSRERAPCRINGGKQAFSFLTWVDKHGNLG